jgi:hypothetical protein
VFSEVIHRRFTIFPLKFNNMACLPAVLTQRLSLTVGCRIGSNSGFPACTQYQIDIKRMGDKLCCGVTLALRLRNVIGAKPSHQALVTDFAF